MVAPPRAAQRNRRGAWFGAAACIASLAGAAVCEQDPSVTTVGGYTITLPPGWSSNEEAQVIRSLADARQAIVDSIVSTEASRKAVVARYRSVSLDSFGDDVDCELQFHELPVTPERFTRITHEHMRASNVAPAVLETGIGRFEGTTFVVNTSEDSPLGEIAQLAGKPIGEAYLGGPPENPVGVVIITFDGEGEAMRKQMRDKCADTIASLRTP
jgi:hypothetical protein